MKSFYLLFSILSFSVISYGQLEETDGLNKTVELLNSPQLRGEVIQKEEKAQRADQRVRMVTNDPQKIQKIYELSSKILTHMSKKSNADTEIMKKDLELGSKNPQGFIESLPPELQEDLRKLSQEIETNAPGQNQP